MAPNESNTNDFSRIATLVSSCGIHEPTSSSDRRKKVEVVGSHPQLGTYNSALLPVLVLCVNMMCGYASAIIFDLRIDFRTQNWLLVDEAFIVHGTAVLYMLASIVWGPRLMRGRKPLQLRRFMMVYNIFQVVLCTYMFMELGLNGWFFDYNYRCDPLVSTMDEKPYRIAKATHWYFLSKILDFVDTALFIARGKLNQVTNLHVIHHGCMFISAWYGVRFFPGGHGSFVAFINSFVHIIMYSYYLLASFGETMAPYLWWKKHLTKLQLIQFVMIVLHAAQLLVFPCKDVPSLLFVPVFTYAIFYFLLFMNFYFKTYTNKMLSRSKKIDDHKKDDDANSLSQNGSRNGRTQDRETSLSFMENRMMHRLPSPAVIN